MEIISRYTNRANTAVEILSGYPGAPVVGEDGNLYNPVGQEIWDAAHADGNTPAPYQEPAPTLADYELAIEAFLNAGVAERQYSSIYTAIGYRFSGNATWAAEAVAANSWRDAVLTVAYDVLAQVQAGSMSPPTVPGLIELLPALVWPAP